MSDLQKVISAGDKISVDLVVDALSEWIAPHSEDLVRAGVNANLVGGRPNPVNAVVYIELDSPNYFGQINW